MLVKPVIPFPIMPDKELIVPDAVGVTLLGGIITALIGLIALIVIISSEVALVIDFKTPFKLAAVLSVTGVVITLIGLILVLVTGQFVE